MKNTTKTGKRQTIRQTKGIKPLSKIHCVHFLVDEQPPLYTLNRHIIEDILTEFDDSEICLYEMKTLQEVGNVVYLDDKLVNFTKTFTPECTKTREERK